MSFVAVCLIVLGLVSFALFFLIFKLIWILCKKKSNFWPLTISGVLAGVIVLAVGIFSYGIYKQYVKPFDPIVETVKAQKTLQEGHKLYTNPQGFAITLYDGTTMSNWIHIDDWNFLVGVDTNMFINKNNSKQPISLYLLGHETDDDPENAHQIMAKVVEGIKQSNSPKASIVLNQVQPIEVGADAAAEMLNATIYPHNSNIPLDFSLVIATKGYDTYFLAGMGNFGNEKILDTVSSFAITQ